MSFNSMFRVITGVLCSCILMVLAGNSLATDWEQTSGDYCNIKNPGGEPAKKYSRKQAGALENISFDFQFTVTCPLIIDNLNESEWFVSARFANYASFTQQYKCVLEEYDLYDLRVRAYTNAINLDPNFVGTVAFDKISLTEPQNRLYMWCALPARSIMGSLIVGAAPDS